MKKMLLSKIILILFLTVSCSNKETKIKEVENLVDDNKDKFNKYSQQDWDKADTLITSLENDIEKNRENYTTQQIENANNVIGKYKAIKIKKELKNLKKSMEDVGQQIQGAIEVFKDSTSLK